MNERDSEEILGMLTHLGYQLADEPEQADVLLLNTCSVREQSEQRAASQMGRFQELKRQRPELILGMLGCMAKAQRDHIFKQLPMVDLVAGPAEIYDLPMLLGEIETRRRKQVNDSRFTNHDSRILAIDRKVRPLDAKPAGDYRFNKVSAFVTIMEGCDKECAYCIVPTTRGQEVSRPPEEILAEITGLVEAGYQEVTLLGQNVNSYGKRYPDGSGYRGALRREQDLAQGTADWVDFPSLLRFINDRTGIQRIRFFTSHPCDAHERLFEAMRDCEAVCEHLHLPVQSGANRMLKAMRRGYTVEAYLAKVERLRSLIPEIALTTDVIVGFPGETAEDVEATAALLQQIRYDGVYLFKYSPRPGTEAADLPDDVPVEVKDERHETLLALQRDISLARRRRYLDQTFEVLIEGPSRHGALFGRTRDNTSVVVDGLSSLIGHVVDVQITEVAAKALTGQLQERKA